MKPAHLRHGLSHAGELRMSECACFPQDIVQVWPMTHCEELCGIGMGVSQTTLKNQNIYRSTQNLREQKHLRNIYWS